MSVDAPNRPAPARRTVSRTAETWITGIGLGLAALLQGGDESGLGAILSSAVGGE